MSEKPKIMIFDTKEMILIFFCIFFLVLISFVMGVKVGKKVSFVQQGFHESDLKVVDLKSTDEEWVASLEQQKGRTHHQEEQHHQVASAPSHDSHNTHSEVAPSHQEEAPHSEHKQEVSHTSAPVAEHHQTSPENHHPPQIAENKIESHQQELKEEFKNIVKDQNPVASKLEESHGGSHLPTGQNEIKTTHSRDSFYGKYTIQLGSYQTEEEAMKFADGFKVRHYDPIIQEVHLEGKGVWYRVSLGIFPGMMQAKEYINKEESLFHGQDYVIVEFQ